MKHSLALLTAACALLLGLCPVTGYAQSSAWELKIDADIMNPILSPNGRYLVYGHKKKRTAECVDARTGASLWSNELTDFKKYEIFRFVNDSVVLLGQANRYEFVNVRDGAVMKSLNIIGKNDWSDLVWQKEAPKEPEYEMIKPYHRANIGIYYFDDGFQVIDLEKQAILMETKDRPSQLQYKEWENVMMILPRGGSDSIYFIDFEKRTLLFRGSTDDHDINTSLYQPFAMNGKELLLFNEKNVESIDLETGQVAATMPVDTDDPDFFLTADLTDGLHLLVSEDDVQQCYRTKDGTKLWETKEKEIPGIVDQIVEVSEGDILLLAYKEKNAAVYKVNLKSGEIAWSRPLFKQRGDLEPGHKEGSKFGAMLKRMAVNMLVNMVLGPTSRSGMRYDPHTGLTSYGRGFNDFTERRQIRENRRLVNNAYASFLSRNKKSDAYMDLLTQNENEVVLVVAGRAYNPEDPKWKEADQEGVFTISLNDGTITKASKATLLADKGGDLNAYTDLKVVQLPVAGASALVGVNDLYVQREGNVEQIPFGKKKITFVTSTDSTVMFSTNDDDKSYDYWLLDAKRTPCGLTLLARSDEPNIVFPPDTSVFSKTLMFNDYTITAHSLTSAKPGEEPTPTAAQWTLTEDDLDKMEIGRLTKNLSITDSIQGIYSTRNGFYLMGEDAVAFITPDGSCKWAQKWDMDREEVRMKPTVLKDHLVVAMGKELMIVKNDCTGTVVAKHKIGFGDSRILTSEEGTVVILDVDDGKIYGYSL